MGIEFFKNAKKNFGFGMMRLPMKDEDVDYEQVKEMVDKFMDAGFNYFDTAHPYISGKSENAVKLCLSSRYPRDSYVLVNKLSGWFFEKHEEIRPLIEKQLEACGVEYFDILLMHAQNRNNFVKYQNERAYETAFELKKEGKVKHVGLSFHDDADTLDHILTTYPQVEVVQIQFNYLDYDDANIQSKKCYDVCVKHNKPIIVMEPVKGGSLVNIPNEAKEVFDNLKNDCLSYASYAIRYACSFPQIKMVLSGMSDTNQMADNLSYMTDFKPLDDKEMAAVNEVKKIILSKNMIPCTGCRYCVDGCPKHILIPDLFACFNNKMVFHDWNQNQKYQELTINDNKASECLKCGLCEKSCPQKLSIRELLEKVSKEFDK